MSSNMTCGRAIGVLAGAEGAGKCRTCGGILGERTRGLGDDR